VHSDLLQQGPCCKGSPQAICEFSVFLWGRARVVPPLRSKNAQGWGWERLHTTLENALAGDSFFFFGSKDVAHATDLRTYPGQLLFNALIAAIHVIDAIQNGFAIGHERRQNQ